MQFKVLWITLIFLCAHSLYAMSSDIVDHEGSQRLADALFWKYRNRCEHFKSEGIKIYALEPYQDIIENALIHFVPYDGGNLVPAISDALDSILEQSEGSARVYLRSIRFFERLIKKIDTKSYLLESLKRWQLCIQKARMLTVLTKHKDIAELNARCLTEPLYDVFNAHNILCTEHFFINDKTQYSSQRPFFIDGCKYISMGSQLYDLEEKRWTETVIWPKKGCCFSNDKNHLVGIFTLNGQNMFIYDFAYKHFTRHFFDTTNKVILSWAWSKENDRVIVCSKDQQLPLHNDGFYAEYADWYIKDTDRYGVIYRRFATQSDEHYKKYNIKPKKYIINHDGTLSAEIAGTSVYIRDLSTFNRIAQFNYSDTEVDDVEYEKSWFWVKDAQEPRFVVIVSEKLGDRNSVVVRVWDAQDGNCVKEHRIIGISKHNDALSCISDDGKHALISQKSDELRYLNLDTGFTALLPQVLYPCDITLSNDGSTLYALIQEQQKGVDVVAMHNLLDVEIFKQVLTIVAGQLKIALQLDCISRQSGNNSQAVYDLINSCAENISILMAIKRAQEQGLNIEEASWPELTVILADILKRFVAQKVLSLRDDYDIVQSVEKAPFKTCRL